MDRGFSSQNISADLGHKCRVAYDRFLAESDAPNWGLTILGEQAPEVTVTITDPSGKTITESMTLTLDTQFEIYDFLLRSHDEWRASKQENK